MLLPDAVMADIFAPGQKLEYFSQNKGVWFQCVVLAVKGDTGAVTINLKPDAPLSAEQAKACLRLPFGAPVAPQPLAAALGPGASAGAVVSTEHAGDIAAGRTLEYFSRAKGGWYECTVQAVDAVAGTVTINLKPLTPLPPEVVQTCLRPLSVAPANAIAMPFAPGMVFEYFSKNKGAWFKCTIDDVDSQSGAVTINLKQGMPLSADEARTLLRPIADATSPPQPVSVSAPAPPPSAGGPTPTPAPAPDGAASSDPVPIMVPLPARQAAQDAASLRELGIPAPRAAPERPGVEQCQNPDCSKPTWDGDPGFCSVGCSRLGC